MKKQFRAALRDYNAEFLSIVRQVNDKAYLMGIASRNISSDRMRKAYLAAYHKPAAYFGKRAYMAADKVKALNPWSEERFYQWLSDYTALTLGERITEVTAFTRERYIQIVKQVLDEMPDASIGDIADVLQEKLQIDEFYRAERIARTEVISASNVGSKYGMDEIMEGEPYLKIWISSMDDRTRDSHEAMNNVEVPSTEPFHLPSGVMLEEPGDPSGPAEEVINCRCSIAYDLMN